MKTVEIFKTNTTRKREAQRLRAELQNLFPLCKINFDLEDRDRILRVEGNRDDLDPNAIIKFMIEKNLECTLLPE